MKEKVNVYTDGACSSNPGPGGWSAVFALDDKIKVISGNEIETTNNRMELTSVIEAIKFSAKMSEQIGCRNIVIHSDSSYVVNAMNCNWINLWESKGWINSKNEKVKNFDLWKKLKELIEEGFVDVTFVKVKGHSGNTLNEIADRRAKEEVLRAKIKRGIDQ